MIHTLTGSSTTAVAGSFGMIGDLDIQPTTIGIIIGIALITGITAYRWLTTNKSTSKRKKK